VVVLVAVDLVAGVRFAVVALAVVLFAVAFFAVAFFAVDAVDADREAVFLAGEDFATVFRAVVVPVALFAVVLLAVVFLAVPAAVVLLAADFLAVAFFAGALDFEVAEVEGLADVVVLAAEVLAVAAETLGSFFAPETIAFRSAPALNFGTAVFFARLRSPVRGLRTIRESRTTFSKAPKPVRATFSPLTSSREMVSSTDSSACPAAFLFPS
jgi:hypothetical protein